MRAMLVVAQAVGLGAILLAGCSSPGEPPAGASGPGVGPSVAATSAATRATTRPPAPGTPRASASSTPGASTARPSTTASAAASVSPRAAAADFKDAGYEVGGRWLRLSGGVSEIEAAPGAASKVVTRYFGNEAAGDLNGDGVADVGFVVTQTAGGSGTFYYAVAALRTPEGWVGTNGVLLGDRVAPQTTEYADGRLVVNYAERRPGEAMSAPPSIGVTKRFRVVGGKLVE